MQLAGTATAQASAIGTLTSPTFADEVLRDTPAAFWRFEETAGATLTDQLGTYPLTITGSVGLGVDGPTDDLATRFPVSTFARTGTVPSMGNAQAFEIVAKFDTLPTGTNSIFIMGAGRSNSSVDSVESIVLRADGSLRYSAYPGLTLDTPIGLIQAGQWYHLVATVNAQVATIYINGQPVASTGYTGSYSSTRRIGIHGGTASSITGATDPEVVAEAVVYYHGLTADRVQAHYTAWDAAIPPLRLSGTATATSSASGFARLAGTLTGTITATSSMTGTLEVVEFATGDRIGTAFVLTGDSGVRPIDLTAMTVDPGEAPALYGSLTHTAWLVHTPTAPGTLTAQITAPPGWTDGVIELMDPDGTTLGPYVRTGQLLTAVAVGQPLYLRVHPRAASGSGGPRTDVAVTWSFTERVSEIIFDVDSPLDEAPGAVDVVIGNTEPDLPFTIDLLDPTVSNPILAGDTGPEGTVQTSVPIPLLAAGDYLLELTVNGQVVAMETLTILIDPLDSTPEPDEFQVDPELDFENEPDPGLIAQHWTFIDPATNDTWTMPHNPTRWSGTNMQNTASFEYDSSAAPDGRLLTWQQSGRPRPFEFEGYLDSEVFYNGLQTWSELHRRFWLIDHRNRRWLITIEQFDPRRRIVPHKPWAHDYSVQGFYFSGPHPAELT